MVPPETRYASSGEVSIAYQVFGAGPIDLVVSPGFLSHQDYAWELPDQARFLQRLAAFARVIRFDKRGTGMSDRIADVPTLEERIDDIRAVMDAAGSERATLYGVSEGGPMSALFAATYPERTRALILYGTYARHHAAPDYPWRPPQPTEAAFQQLAERTRQSWGTPEAAAETLRTFAPSLADDERYRRLFATTLRLAASPGTVIALARMNQEIDIRHVLPAIRVPTLVLHRRDDRVVRVENGRYLAARIPGAKYVELGGEDHIDWAGDAAAVADEIEEFLTGQRHSPEPDRVLATVLFTDVVGSTERAAALGDRAWRDLLASYYTLVRKELDRFRGREVKTVGDGVLATFDGPARAIRSACAIRDAVRQLGLEVKLGLHTGECELIGDDIGGIAVHIGQRVSALAAPGEVLVSSTVKDLVAGSGIRFQDRGVHTLKGVPDEWRLYAVTT